MVLRVRITASRLLIALSALGVVIAAAMFWPGAYQRLDELWPSQVPESAVSLPPGTFTPIMSKGGGWYTTEGDINEDFYLARDGSEVSFSRMNTRSPAKAAEQMRKLITTYTDKEAERRDVLDGSGKKVGERATGLRRVDTRGQIRVAVLWTEGSDFCSIEGASLELVLEFERYKVGH